MAKKEKNTLRRQPNHRLPATCLRPFLRPGRAMRSSYRPPTFTTECRAGTETVRATARDDAERGIARAHCDKGERRRAVSRGVAALSPCTRRWEGLAVRSWRLSRHGPHCTFLWRAGTADSAAGAGPFRACDAPPPPPEEIFLRK